MADFCEQCSSRLRIPFVECRVFCEGCGTVTNDTGKCVDKVCPRHGVCEACECEDCICDVIARDEILAEEGASAFAAGFDAADAAQLAREALEDDVRSRP